MGETIDTEERGFGYRSQIQWYVWEFVKKDTPLQQFKKIVQYIYRIHQDDMHIWVIAEALMLQKEIYTDIGDRVGSRMMTTRLKWLDKEFGYHDE